MTAKTSTAHERFRAARDLLLACHDDYPRAYRDFRWPRSEHFNWAHDWFDVVAEGNDRMALRVIGPDRECRATYAQLARRSDQVAAWLGAEGIRAGDRVLVLVDNAVEYWELQLALMKLRVLIAPVFTSLPADEIAERLTRVGANHVVARSEVAAALPGLAAATKVRVAIGPPVPGWLPYDDSYGCVERLHSDEPTPADEPLFCLFTSGTTARPKMVLHSHSSYAVGHLSSMYLHRLRLGDVHLNVSAPAWAKHAWSSFFAPFNAEATVVSMEPGAVTPQRIRTALAEVGADSFCAPPSTWRAVLDTEAGIDDERVRLREALSVGEPLTADLVERARRRWGVVIRNGYGQSELTAVAGVVDACAPDPTVLGHPLPGYRLTLDPPGGEGEICVDLAERPAGAMLGYLGDTGEVQFPGAGGRRYRTGDLARRGADGSFVFLGRLTDAIESVQGPVLPVELERALIDAPAVREVAVVPVGHDGGRVAKAYVRLSEGWNTAEATALTIFGHLAETGARGLHLIEFIDVFPRTESGKIHRELLRTYPRSAHLEFVAPWAG